MNILTQGKHASWRFTSKIASIDAFGFFVDLRRGRGWGTGRNKIFTFGKSMTTVYLLNISKGAIVQHMGQTQVLGGHVCRPDELLSELICWENLGLTRCWDTCGHHPLLVPLPPGGVSQVGMGLSSFTLQGPLMKLPKWEGSMQACSFCNI